MNIGEASKHTGLQVKTIRYYEEIGLVRADRQANGYRDYAQNHLQKLLFLKRSRQFNFSLGECRQLLGLYEDEKRESASLTLQ